MYSTLTLESKTYGLWYTYQLVTQLLVIWIIKPAIWNASCKTTMCIDWQPNAANYFHRILCLKRGVLSRQRRVYGGARRPLQPKSKKLQLDRRRRFYWSEVNKVGWGREILDVFFFYLLSLRHIAFATLINLIRGFFVQHKLLGKTVGMETLVPSCLPQAIF